MNKTELVNNKTYIVGDFKMTLYLNGPDIFEKNLKQQVSSK